MKTKWYSLLTPFYGVVESIKRLGYGFVPIYLFRIHLEHPSILKSICLSSLGIIFIWVLGKFLQSLFELSISHWYVKDVNNYCESDAVLNRESKKLEMVNHLITVSERYSNPEYRKYLFKIFSVAHFVMLVIGIIMGFMIQVIHI